MELAERCEKAEGPDRELDGLIWAHLKAGDPYIIGHKPGRFPREPIVGERADIMRDIGGKDGAEYIGAPEFTASLDAAMTLVPEGWHWSLYDSNGSAVAERAIAQLESDWGVPDPPIDGEGMTPALALTAAALRARAAQEPQS